VLPAMHAHRLPQLGLQSFTLDAVCRNGTPAAPLQSDHKAPEGSQMFCTSPVTWEPLVQLPELPSCTLSHAHSRLPYQRSAPPCRFEQLQQQMSRPSCDFFDLKLGVVGTPTAA
jgi:hypothetical protein